MICLWLEIIVDIILNQSAITSRFTDSLGSFKPNRQLLAIGHGCARTAEAEVTVVSGYGRGCAPYYKHAESRHCEDNACAYST